MEKCIIPQYAESHGIMKKHTSYPSVGERRGVVAQQLERKILIHAVVGSNPSVVTLSVLPKLGGWMTMLQRSKSRPTKVGLAPGEVPQCRLLHGSWGLEIRHCTPQLHVC